MPQMQVNILDLDVEVDLSQFTQRELHEARNTLDGEILTLLPVSEGRTVEEAMCDLDEDTLTTIEALQDRLRLVDELLTERESRSQELADNFSRARESRPRQHRTPHPQAGHRGPEPTSWQSPLPNLNKYSIMRGLRCLVEKRTVDGLEGEVSAELVRVRGTPATGFLVPWSLPRLPGQTFAQESRAVNTTSGAGMIPTIVDDTIIDLLRAGTLFGKLGARFLNNMEGNFSIPKQTEGTQHYFVSEGSAVTESNVTIGQVNFTPKTIGAFSTITRKVINMANQSVEALVRDDLMKAVAVGMDLSGFNGTGLSGQPKGLFEMDNPALLSISNGTNGGAPTWDKLVEMETAIRSANYLADLKMVVTPKLMGKLKTTLKAANTSATYLYDRGAVNEVPCFSSNLLRSDITKGSGTNLSQAILGDFSQVVFATWSGLDLNVDDKTLATSGSLRVVVLADFDINTRREQAFCKANDYVTA